MESQRALPAKLAHRDDNLSLSTGAHLCQPRQQPGRQPHSRWDRCRRRPRGRSDLVHSPPDRAEGGRATWPPRDPRRWPARRGPHHFHGRPSRRTALVRREAGAQLWSCRGERQDPERLAWIRREDRAKAFGPAHPLLDRARGQPERCDAHAALPHIENLRRQPRGRRRSRQRDPRGPEARDLPGHGARATRGARQVHLRPPEVYDARGPRAWRRLQRHRDPALLLTHGAGRLHRARVPADTRQDFHERQQQAAAWRQRPGWRRREIPAGWWCRWQSDRSGGRRHRCVHACGGRRHRPRQGRRRRCGRRGSCEQFCEHEPRHTPR
mmetsp:Transcript_45613/g.148246  ORF Transcript_45613/g.148246 Transcript_45613/m.148246 type:complete len:325 (-) Transcript_45613:159-1133(-)